LAASSWDGKVRIWDVKTAYPSANTATAQPMAATDMTEPVLQITWNTQGNMVFAGSGDGNIKVWDLQQNRVVNMAQRSMAVAQVHWCSAMNVLYAMSWDRTITIWDGKQPNPIMTSTVDLKPHYMSVNFPMMAVATANRKIVVYDLNKLRQNMFQPVATTESLLKYNTKSLAAFGNGWILGSIEGRCEVRTIDFNNPTMSLQNTTLNYTFKAHRDKNIYPVNTLAFNNVFGTFASAGGDGRLYLWDKDARMKLKGFPEARTLSANKNYPATTVLPIVDCAFSAQGNIIAVAFGYDWAKGVAEYEDFQNEIHIHVLSKEEIEKRPSHK
jgi:mRNA export factor